MRYLHDDWTNDFITDIFTVDQFTNCEKENPLAKELFVYAWPGTVSVDTEFPEKCVSAETKNTIAEKLVNCTHSKYYPAFPMV